MELRDLFNFLAPWLSQAIGGAIAALVALGVVGRLAWGRREKIIRSAAESLGEIRVKRLMLIDESGHVRARLAVGSDGASAMTLYNVHKDGEIRAVLTVRAGAEPGWEVTDQSGNTRARIHVCTHGAPALRLYDRSGEVRISLGFRRFEGSKPDSFPGLELFDEEARQRLWLHLYRNGEPDIALSHLDGHVRARFSVTPDGSGSVDVTDLNGKPMLPGKTSA